MVEDRELPDVPTIVADIGVNRHGPIILPTRAHGKRIHASILAGSYTLST